MQNQFETQSAAEVKDALMKLVRNYGAASFRTGRTRAKTENRLNEDRSNAYENLERALVTALNTLRARPVKQT